MLKRIKLLIKEAMLKRFNIPYSRHGLPTILLPYLENRMSISMIDIGAHRGDFVDVVAKYTTIKKALLVEPIPELARGLSNRFSNPNFNIYNCALSDREGLAEFEINDATATSSLLRINRDMSELADISLGSSKFIQCQTRTLDDVVKEANINSVYLLKIDVQGAEDLVLLGGKETLNITSLAWVEVSFKPLYENSCTFIDVYNILYESGFIFVGIDPVFYAPNRELLQADALFVRKGVRIGEV